MHDHDKYKCRVCGLDHHPDMPWGEDGQLPSFDICLCCGVQFGYGDSHPAADDLSDATTLKGYCAHLASIRSHWVQVENCEWFSPEFRPTDWDMPAQIRGIESRFTDIFDENLIEEFETCGKEREIVRGLKKLRGFEN